MKSVRVEMRLSIYGNSESNWSDLAQWACRWNVYSPSNRWMIQTPRIYRIFRKIGKVSSFQQYLDNIFAPLFAVTIDPAVNPDLDRFLQEVSGFDSVDDESVAEPSLISVSPEEVRVSRPIAVQAKSLTFVWGCLVSSGRARRTRHMPTSSSTFTPTWSSSTHCDGPRGSTRSICGRTAASPVACTT